MGRSAANHQECSQSLESGHPVTTCKFHKSSFEIKCMVSFCFCDMAPFTSEKKEFLNIYYTTNNYVQIVTKLLTAIH